MVENATKLRLSSLFVFFGLLLFMGCDGALPATGDTLVPVAQAQSARGAARGLSIGGAEKAAAEAKVAILYSSNNHGEIDPCG